MPNLGSLELEAQRISRSQFSGSEKVYKKIFTFFLKNSAAQKNFYAFGTRSKLVETDLKISTHLEPDLNQIYTIPLLIIIVFKALVYQMA